MRTILLQHTPTNIVDAGNVFATTSTTIGINTNTINNCAARKLTVNGFANVVQMYESIFLISKDFKNSKHSLTTLRRIISLSLLQ